ncbi:methionine ABC transporter permease [Haloplasma contractile]|uniref:Methionine import system permease protein MetP n=1 Tax=Haloplasma contractile SSD-17B TaxID=1033810 RepID=F7Q195_9MOLU|nr:methionine ABC transporter permease [Haloplasma contractile]ERJ12812.1 Methionine import system permease protein MetP [Haloplasma contractile SSD-17B]
MNIILRVDNSSLKGLIDQVKWDKMIEATYETLYMTLITAVLTFIIGIILGLLLYMTSKNNKSTGSKLINLAVSAIINVFRSIPFLILIILLIPFTKVLIGTILGPNAALPALVIGSAPFYARLVVIGLREVDKGVIEAARSMGANELEIIFKVLLPESKPALVSGITVTTIMLVGYTALAGAIGSGGLGDLAYFDGFQRNRMGITFVSTIIILIIVFIIQFIGDQITKHIDKR